MSKNIRVKPGKGQSVSGFIGGLMFCLIGIFVAIPTFGGFGIIWTLFAVIITVTCGINAFSDKGIATHEIIVEDDEEESGFKSRSHESAKTRMEQVKELYDTGVISSSEYEEKRKQILDEI